MNIFMGHYKEALIAMHETIGVNLAIVEKNKHKNSQIVDELFSLDIKCAQVETSHDILSAIRSLNANCHFCLVASFGLILTNEILADLKEVVNLHPGDVYKFRGRHPLPETIRSGTPFSTLSVHYIDNETIDRGRLIAQLSVAIDYSKSYEKNETNLRNQIYPLMRKILEERKLEGQLPAWEWKPDNHSYKQPLSRTELQEITKCPSLEHFKGA